MKIFLNPGHAEGGMPDPGACSMEYGEDGLKEYALARKIAEIAAYYLRVAHEEVKILQSHNLIGEAPAFPCITDMANEWDADLFLSIHVNAGGGRGCETFCYQKHTAGALFAAYVQNELYLTINRIDEGYRNRGVYARPGLAVLRGTKMPAALVEIGFIDRIEDAWLMSQYPDSFARGLARGITSYEASLGGPNRTRLIDTAVRPL